MSPTKKIPSVLEVIANRVKTGNRQDGWKVGVVMEAGAMRGVMTGGATVGLQALGIFEAIDQYHGDSSGAYNYVYWASDNAALGASIFYQDLIRRFISWTRIPPIKVSYLTDEVMARKRINFEKIRDSHVEDHIYVSSAKDGKLADFSVFESEEQLRDILLWTGQIPVMGGMPIKTKTGKAYVDGAVLASSLPLSLAVGAGCTHLLVLRLSEHKTKRKKMGLFEWVNKLILRVAGYPELAKNLHLGVDRYNEALNLIEQSRDNTEMLPRIEPIVITDSRIWNLCRDPKLLRKGAVKGYDKVIEVFKPYDLPVDESVKVI